MQELRQCKPLEHNTIREGEAKHLSFFIFIQMKTNLIVKFLSILAIFFLPVMYISIAVGVVIFWKTYSDFWNLKNQPRVSRKKRCDKRKEIGLNLATTMLKYQLIILTIWAIDKYIIYGFGVAVGLPTKIVAAILITMQLFQIESNYKQINGKGMIDHLKHVANWVKDIKNTAKDVIKVVLIAGGILALLSFIPVK